MKQVQKASAAIAAAALFTLPPVSIETTTAKAYEFRRRDVTGHMTGCSFDTMGQCEAMRYGLGGDYFRDPFLKDSSNAYAQVPKHQGLRQGKILDARHP
jgi:hypothetical protein